MSPQTKTILTHLSGVLGGVLATLAWASTQGVDLYAAWNQLNTIVADVTKFVATITPIATTAYAVYRTATKNRLVEIAADPKAIEAAKEIPVTPQTVALADALKEGGK